MRRQASGGRTRSDSPSSLQSRPKSWLAPDAPGAVFAADLRQGAICAYHPDRFVGWGEWWHDKEGFDEWYRNKWLQEESHGHKKLGQLMSTAICGNDITSSCFYVTGALANAAGIWAPIGAAFAAMTLWLFRWVYTEAVTALPFNGGIYNILLNTLQRKKVAALVATLTMLSYIATAVVSALSAGAYLQSLIDDKKTDPMESGCYVLFIAVGLLVFFCILKLIGISESAVVASFLFCVHMFTMAVLAIVAFFAIALPVHHLPFSLVCHNISENFKYTGGGGNFSTRVMLGFANAMLGVSGFESSANFVEEQEPGVFPKTLRNMWYAVSILNMTFIVECLFATELSELVPNAEHSLSFLARKTGGQWLAVWVSIDAFLVLAASVLTSYVGFGGLTQRMAGDRCLPSIFRNDPEKNSTLGDKVSTIIFMFVCISLTLILKGEQTSLSACYSFAFLTVMSLFAISVMVLRLQRPKLPTEMKPNAMIPTLAFVLVVIALANAIIENHDVIPIFAAYLGTLVFIMACFTNRVRFLVKLQQAVGTFCPCCKKHAEFLGRRAGTIRNQSSVVYFSKTANLYQLNKAIVYIKQNEDANRCRVVHCYENESEIPRALFQCCMVLDCLYPSVKVDVLFVQGKFGAPMIKYLEKTYGVPTNLMFITCPRSEHKEKRIQELRGARVIMGHEIEPGDRAEGVTSMTSDLPEPISLHPAMDEVIMDTENPRPLSTMAEKGAPPRTDDSSHRHVPSPRTRIESMGSRQSSNPSPPQSWDPEPGTGTGMSLQGMNDLATPLNSNGV